MASANPIKTVIFDLGKVIVNFDHLITCRRLAQYCPCSPEEVYENIFSSGLEEQLDTGSISPDVFFEAVSCRLNLNIEIELFMKVWKGIFTLNPGIEQLINRLKSSFKLLCISNTNQWHFEYCLETFPVLNSFDLFILSFKVGRKKPHNEIFKKAMAEADALPQECVYIDDIKDFVKAAECSGMKGIHFISVAQLERQLEVAGVL